MSLRLRRGTNAQRVGITFDLGEPIWVTNTNKMYVGDNVTAGGVSIIKEYAGTGLQYNATTDTLELANFVVNSDDVEEGNNNLYFTPGRAQNAAAALFTAGTHTNISYIYDDVAHAINSTVTIGAETVQDLIAPLFTGGIHSGITFTYDDNNNRLNAAVTINPEDIQDAVGLMFDHVHNNGVIASYSDENNRIELSLDSEAVEDIVAGLFNAGTHVGANVIWNNSENSISVVVDQIRIVEDTVPELGGDLDLNNFSIIGVGDISFTGTINVSDEISGSSIGSYSGFISSFSSIKLQGDHTVIYTPTNGDNLNPGWIDLSSYKGTFETPTNLLPGEYASSLVFKSYFDDDYRVNAAIGVVLDADATLNSQGIVGVPSEIQVFLKSNVGLYGGVTYNFKSSGCFEAPILQPGSYLSTEVRDAAIPYPTAGMMILVNRDGITINTTGDTTDTSNIVLTTAAAPSMVGALILGPGIPIGAVIASVSAGVSVTMDVDATDTATGVDLTIIEGVPKFQGCTEPGSGTIGNPGYVPPTWVNLNS
jgi:hypothetical protein